MENFCVDVHEVAAGEREVAAGGIIYGMTRILRNTIFDYTVSSAE